MHATNLVKMGPLDPPQTPVQIAKRPFLAGSDHPAMPTMLSQPPSETFPLHLQPASHASQADMSLAAWALDVKSWVESKLHECGAILVRGLPIATAEDLSVFTAHLGYGVMSYEGGTAIRHDVSANVMTASNEPPEVSMEPHNEMAYARVYPSKILFFCETAPSEGGETPIADVRQGEKHLDSAFREKIVQTGIRYMRYLPCRSDSTYTAWQDAFFTEDKQVVEAFCREHRYDFEWDDDDNLTYSYVLPPTVMHPKTGEEIWFNHLAPHHASYFSGHPDFIHSGIDPHRYPFHCQFGDGTEFSPEEIAQCSRATWLSAVPVSWQRGDMLILDNVLAQHGRMSFVGDRRLLVTLFK